MDNNYKEILEAHSKRLIRIDSQKQLVEKMLEDFRKQYDELTNDWEEAYSSYQYYLELSSTNS